MDTLFLVLLVAIATADVLYRKIPHHLLFIAALTATVRLYSDEHTHIAGPSEDTFHHLALTGFPTFADSGISYILILGLLCTGAAYIATSGQEGIGMGDIKLLILLWLWYFPNLIAYVTNATISFLVLYLWTYISRADDYPFAPFALFATTILL